MNNRCLAFSNVNDKNLLATLSTLESEGKTEPSLIPTLLHSYYSSIHHKMSNLLSYMYVYTTTYSNCSFIFYIARFPDVF